MFTGQIGGDRAVVTTSPFPHLGTAVQHGLPFTWAFPSYNPADGATVEVGPHIVTYFEVTIEEQVDPDPEPSSRRRMAAQMPRQGYVYVDLLGGRVVDAVVFDEWHRCVAVGVATKKFPLSLRMPGWDAFSCQYCLLHTPVLLCSVVHLVSLTPCKHAPVGSSCFLGAGWQTAIMVMMATSSTDQAVANGLVQGLALATQSGADWTSVIC
jgi:hypothetical protein